MKPLRVAILHYHLRGGGVTRIIEHTFQALQRQSIQLCVITGEAPPDDCKIPKENIAVVPGLSYGEDNPRREAADLLEEIQQKAAGLLGDAPQVWHIHNHSLGKNAESTKAFLSLAEQQKVLFHIHDFAEDNRPENYQYLREFSNQKKLSEQLYPQAPHIYYAVLNGRDFKYLKKAGFVEENLHLLSNPVSLELENSEPQKEMESRKLYVYPCRVIPRKNIGEFLLWAALADEDEHFAVTLAPKNEKYQEDYRKWTDFTEHHKLPATFEAGKKWGLSFPELLQRADAFISTSIAEGFGLIYLESWLAERPLVGRILPDIVADFKRRGLRFPGMYDQLKVPVSWIGEEPLKERFEEAIAQNFKKYELNIDQQKLQMWMDELLADAQVDFGKLDLEFQQRVIAKLGEDPGLRDDLVPSELARNVPEQRTIKANKKKVEQEFSLPNYGTRLSELYRQISRKTTGDIHFADARSLLYEFQSPQNFSLLRS